MLTDFPVTINLIQTNNIWNDLPVPDHRCLSLSTERLNLVLHSGRSHGCGESAGTD